MTESIRDLLPLHVLGLLEGEEAARVERALGLDPALAAEFAALQDTAAQLIAAPAPVAPSEDVKLRLMASIGGGRFDHFAARIGDLFEVNLDRAREILGRAEQRAAWVDPIPGIGVSLYRFRGGPRLATADCGFVRLQPGCSFPPHAHLGTERTLVLQGTLLDRTTGRRLRPGDEMVHVAGASLHDIAADTEEVIGAVCAEAGIQLAGTTGRAG